MKHMTEITERLMNISRSRLLLISIAVSVLLTWLIVSGMSILLQGRITRDYLITGSVTALIVSLIVSYLLLLLIDQMRKSEERFRLLFESATDAVFVLDERGNFIDVNSAAYSRLGYAKEEMLSMHISRLEAPEFAARVPERLQQLAQYGQAVFESAHVRKDGTIMLVEVNTKLVLLGGKKVVFSIIRDITERKRAREELAGQKAMLQQILDTSIVAIFLVDKAGRITHSNRRMAEMFGYAMDDLIGREYVEMVHPAEREEGRRKMLALLASEIAAVDLERHYWRKDGMEFWGHLAGRRFHDVRGNELGLIGVISDVTERKLAEEALKESERSLATLMGNLPGMAYRCRSDREWTMEYVSEGILELTGYQPADLLGNAKVAYNDLIDPEDQQAVWDAVQQAVRQKQKFTLNYRIRAADGREKWVWEQGQGVFSEGGELLALEGFITDVSERRLLEEERLKTEKLESIGTLAGGIAHDFNNLLQGVFGYISMARMTFDQKEKSLAMLEQAEKALHQSVSLTSQLLTFSKGGKPVKSVIDLRPVIENAAKFALSGSRSSFLLDIEPDLWQADADGGQVGQVIQNIVLNADQAMPLGGRVAISARNVPASDAASHPGLERCDYLVIGIEDQGIGIQEAYLDKIFDPYFTTKEKGSGLGLATSYSIIRNHGGLIEVGSVPGKGSVFRIYLPADRAKDSLSAERPQPAPARKARVLVMDDEPIIRRVAQEMLGSLGHDVAVAEHGEAAVEQYQRAIAEGRPFDVVILDLTIRGGKSGDETLRELLEIDPGVKAVVSSGYSDDEVVATYRQHGFRSFLKKPYDIQELCRILDEVMV
jgi:PAS domain S-box-containing protein